MPSGVDASFEPVPAARSRALERRLRRRRQEARIRLRLVADAAFLSGHHASQVPLVGAPAMTGNLAGQQRLTGLQLQLSEPRAEVATLRGNLEGLSVDSHGCAYIIDGDLKLARALPSGLTSLSLNLKDYVNITDES